MNTPGIKRPKNRKALLDHQEVLPGYQSAAPISRPQSPSTLPYEKKTHTPHEGEEQNPNSQQPQSKNKCESVCFFLTTLFQITLGSGLIYTAHHFSNRSTEPDNNNDTSTQPVSPTIITAAYVLGAIITLKGAYNTYKLSLPKEERRRGFFERISSIGNGHGASYSPVSSKSSWRIG